MNDPFEDSDDRMTFLDHLEELRWHLVRSVIAIGILTISAFVAKTIVFEGIILAPTRLDFWTYKKLCLLSNELHLGDNLCIQKMGFVLSNIHMAGQFTQHIFVSFFVGLMLGFPYLFWEVWRFIKPGLNKAEKRYARGVVFFSSILFLSGALFGYYFLTPMSVQFLGNYQVSESINNAITLSSYISTMAGIVFATALVFELPIAVFFLSRIGIITPKIMKEHRKHAFVVVLILSAVITPPDVTSQLLLGVPFFLLYELSIGISAMVYRKQKIRDEE